MASLIHRDTNAGFNTSSSVVTSGSITLSSLIVAGDLLVAKVYTATLAGTLAGFSPTPAGWSSPAANSANNAAVTMGVIVFTKTAVAADAGAAFTVDFTGLNVYQWMIEVNIAYATDGVTPTMDGSPVFTASAGAVSSLNLSVPALSQNGELIFCSVAGAFAVNSDQNNGISFNGAAWGGPIPIVGYRAFSANGHVGGIGGAANQMLLEAAYFGWHTTTNVPTPGFFNGNTTTVLAVTYALKAANPGAVFMGFFQGRFAGFGVPQATSATVGYMPGAATNIVGTVLFAAIAQSNNVGSPVGQAITADPSWKSVAHVVDVTSTFSVDVFSHVVAGGDPTTWPFSVPSSTVLWAGIYTVGLIDTTTPADVVATASQPLVNAGAINAGGIVAPPIVPKAADEMLLWFFGQRSHTAFFGTVSLSTGPSVVWVQPFGNGGNGIAGMGYGGVENCATQFCYDRNGNFNDAGAGVTLALKASGAIVRPTANMRVDQMAIIALGLGAVPAPPIPPVGTFRGFGYDFGLKQWFIVDFPFSIRAASFMPQTIVAVAKAYQSLVAGANDGTIRRIFASNVGGLFGIDPDWDGVPIQTSMQFPDWGFPGTPVYVRRMNARITFDGGGAAPKITGVTFNAVLRSGQAVTQTLNTPSSILSTIDVGVTVLSGSVTLKGQGQMLIEGTDAQISDKQTGRIGQ